MERSVPKKEKSHVTLKVQRHGAEDILVRMKLDVPLRRLKLDYCDRFGLNSDEVRFTYDGDRIGDKETAGYLKMEDDDVVDVWSDQLGGGVTSLI
ncbi:hypothetical protein Vadar_020911 [Vaccinium darrowii]|uniref:Uncharacterized protein n=1 Tax=Vaccinium darrowii TaxID=229202 RepID=A0ACB7YNS7_9ERIC|nr:hypothetical protein Vadar_020911 [Vaccinium darrowii]